MPATQGKAARDCREAENMQSNDAQAIGRKRRKQRKYHPEMMIPALRLFVKARNEAIALGFTDNGGAIHAVERILDMLSVQLKYPHLSHINDFKKDPNAERSVGADEARRRGESIFIEHVLPQRAYARKVIDLVDSGADDATIRAFIKDHYRLVLLTKEETTLINRKNRSKITADRIGDAGIALQRAQSN